LLCCRIIIRIVVKQCIVHGNFDALLGVNPCRKRSVAGQLCKWLSSKLHAAAVGCWLLSERHPALSLLLLLGMLWLLLCC
jgi:hypothetical protein